MVQVQIASYELSPVIAYARCGNGGAAVIFTDVATVVANRSKPDEPDGPVGLSLHFGVWGCQVAAQAVRWANVNQKVVLTDYSHTSPSAERSWLLITGTTGSHIFQNRLVAA